MAVTVFNTQWGQIVAQLTNQDDENDGCDFAPHGCILMAYLRRANKNETLAIIHNHGTDGIFVVNKSVTDQRPDGNFFLTTGPYASIKEAAEDAAKIGAFEAERQADMRKKGSGTVLPGKAFAYDLVAQNVHRSWDKLDYESSKSATIPWQQQLHELLGWRID